jgi:hypothetical protein
MVAIRYHIDLVMIKRTIGMNCGSCSGMSDYNSLRLSMPEVNERRPQAVQCLIEGMCSIHLKNSTRSWLQDHKRVREVRGTSKNLERMARAAIVRSDEAPRSEDTGLRRAKALWSHFAKALRRRRATERTKYPTEGQRSMAGREQVHMESAPASIAAGARFFEVPLGG